MPKTNQRPPVRQPQFPLMGIFRQPSILLLLAVAGAVMSAALYLDSQRQLRSTENQLMAATQNLERFQADPQLMAKQETQDLIDKVGQLIVLPTGEEPTIATVTDLNALQDQPFFANAQVGDKVLIYTQAKRAVLYRPSTNRVIEVAPLNLGADATAGSSTTVTKKAPPPPVDPVNPQY